MKKQIDPSSSSRRKRSSKSQIPKKKSPKKLPSQKQRLEQELISLLPDVDEEGLIFLIKQAQVIIHNLQVDRINREVEELEKRKRSTGRAAPDGAAREAVDVDIEESSDGKSFYLVLPTTRKVLALEEMRLLVRACYEPKRKSEALNRIYRWMLRERRDILSDGNIQNNTSKLLDALFYRIRSKYRLRDD
jgi:hypothetical protein